MIPPATPHGARAYNEALLALHIRYGGDTWPLADAVGAASVASLRGVTPATPSAGGLTFGATGPFIHGQTARACAFDGAAGFASVAPSPIDPSGAWSFSCWLKCTNPSGASRQNVIGCGRSDTNRFGAQVAVDTIRCTYYDGSSYSRSAAFTTGWHHLCITKAAGAVVPGVYVDAVAGAGTGSATVTGVDKTVIGARNDASPTLFFGGFMLYASFFNAALSAADLRTLYTLGRAGQ